jgi:AraC family transcriptional regulator
MFYGAVIKTVEAPGLRLAEVNYHSGLRTPKHCHERALLVISLQGISTQVYGNEPSTCKPWTVAFHPPGEIHWDHFFAPGVRDLNIEFDPTRLSVVREYSDMVDRSFASNGFESRWLAARIYREFSLFDELSPLAIEGLVIELLVELSRSQPRGLTGTPIWLKKASEIIHARFTERLSLAELSSSVGVHPVHLAREFRRFFHRTVGQEMRYLRIELACRELGNRSYTLNDVALMAGFSDQSHFGRTFKNVTGMTPVQFQAQIALPASSSYPRLPKNAKATSRRCDAS